MDAAVGRITPFAWRQAAPVALAVNVFGFFDGFALSAIKRDRGLKDWGPMIKRCDGMLDRVDSLRFSAPVSFRIARYGWT